MTKRLYQIGVIGAGLMGHGIALTLARAGHQVVVCDPSEETLKSAPLRMVAGLKALGEAERDIPDILARIELSTSTAVAVRKAEIVFEAAPEKLDLKRRIFAEVEAHASQSCILASNTSVMPITDIMAPLSHPERALGTHWWNPPHLIPLVEVVKTRWTDDAYAVMVHDLLADAGKTPVMVEKDVPGFIGNRLQHALWREAISLVENGICSAKAVDDVVKSSFGRRLAVLGPLENADLVGTDLTLDIHQTVLADLETRKGPSPYLEELVAQGRLGMKTGEGFRQWSDEDANYTKGLVARHLQRLDRILID
jgi:3-hydroxybutyryl-CoA dehydrogenase